MPTLHAVELALTDVPTVSKVVSGVAHPLVAHDGGQLSVCSLRLLPCLQYLAASLRSRLSPLRARCSLGKRHLQLATIGPQLPLQLAGPVFVAEHLDRIPLLDDREVDLLPPHICHRRR